MVGLSIINGRTCFVKSSSYDNNRRQCFQGVDPKKIEEDGDLVLLWERLVLLLCLPASS